MDIYLPPEVEECLAHNDEVCWVEDLNDALESDDREVYLSDDPADIIDYNDLSYEEWLDAKEQWIQDSDMEDGCAC